jgi:hypothetical protein
MINKRGQKVGTQRGNRQRFPYEPRVVRGKLMMPAELQAIHRYVLETPKLEDVTEEVRAVIETVWPELLAKLPQGPDMPLHIRPSGFGDGPHPHAAAPGMPPRCVARLIGAFLPCRSGPGTT